MWYYDICGVLAKALWFTQLVSFVPVALNYQTDGRMMQIYKGRFKSNGNCGYVLKPGVTCEGEL